DIMTRSLENSIPSEGLCDKDQDVWCLDKKQLFTTHSVEEGGDPDTVSPQLELEEAIRLSELKKDSELLINSSPCIPEHPEVPCPGEEKSVHHRASSCRRKLYYANGHTFQVKHVSRQARCAVCTDLVGVLGHQLYKCINCKLLVHKKCHKHVISECGQHSLPPEPMVPVDPSSMALDPALTAIPHILSTHEALEQVDEENEAGNTGEGGKASSAKSPAHEDFDLLQVIGRGSYGIVQLVQLKKSNCVYAMKTVKKEHFYTYQVQRERHILQQISNYPLLVGLHACFQTESTLFLVLDYVSGGDLLFHVQQQSMLPEEHARFYSAEISLAVIYLHQLGIIHRNLKMENVLLDSEGHIKVTDYCLSKEGLQPGDMTRTFCGTPHFMALEILRDEDYSFGVHWWALGVMMMIGESPFHLDESSDKPYEDSLENLFHVILERDIVIPHFLSVQAASI
ncbi:Protein kinase C iota type, partial [Heterocephalus glaber]